MRGRIVLGLALLVGANIVSASRAHAQTEAGPTASELAEEEARALFNAGAAAFDAGRFEDALWSFQRAYDRSGRAQLLYNVAQCHDRLRQDDQALAAFERYLELVPTAANRMQVEARIALLREAIARRDAPPIAVPPRVEVVPTPTEVAAATPTPEPPTQPTASTERPSHRGRRIALIAGSAAIVAAAVVTMVVIVRRPEPYSTSDVGVVFALHGGLR